MQAVRGMQDFLPEKADVITHIESKAREVFNLFGYGEIRTPILEPLPLFERALGQTSDIVEKEMFTLKDRGDRLLVLRPEGTAGVVRSFIENSLGKKSAATRLFYVGPMFRAERPQAGRFRQFHQIGSEYFGNASPSADAETIVLAARILQSAVTGFLTGEDEKWIRASGFAQFSDLFEIRLNSLGCKECRPVYQRKLLDFLHGKIADLCDDCKRRMEKNPLRALDCKADVEKLKDAPKSLESLCGECRNHHEKVKSLLSAAGCTFKETPQMVRGLDYYTRTVFEIYPSNKTGSQDALAAGGRYDGLVEELGGEATPAVGFALGVERVSNCLAETATPQEEKTRENGIFVASLGEKSLEKCFEILNLLRSNGIKATGLINNQSLKSQMRLADSLGARFCVIIGDDELKDNFASLKDLGLKTQEKVPMQELIDTLKKKIPAQ